MKRKKCLGVFLSLLMAGGLILHGLSTPAYADELINVITGASITDTNGNDITEAIGAWQPFRINIDYTLPDDTVHEGDTTTIMLPMGIVPASPFSFEVKDGNNVVANGQIIDGDPAKVVLTYTNYAEGKSDIEGKFSFNVQIDNAVYTSDQDIFITLFVNEDIVPAGFVPYKTAQMPLQDIVKSGWMWSQDSTVGIYQIKINQKNNELIDAKITDTLLNPGVSYIPGTLEVFQGKWELTPAGDDVKMTNPVTVTDQYINKITYNNNPGFTIDIGNMPAGTGLWFRYRVKIAYTPLVDEEFKNEATFTNDGIEYRDNYTYKILGAGGSGEGYSLSVEINKTDPDGNPLKDAVFDIIRVRSGATVGQITTDANGHAKLDGLLRDDYILHESMAPNGFEPAEDVNVLSADFNSGTKKASKTIIDKKIANTEKISVNVTKKWVGKEADSVTVKLLADNAEKQEATLTRDNNWKHEFKNLPKYDKDDGHEIIYTVKEENVPGYSTTITGDAVNGYIITNTEETPATPGGPATPPTGSATPPAGSTTPPTGFATPPAGSAAHNKPNAQTETPNTGDTSKLTLYGGMMIVILGGIRFIIGRRKKRS